MAWWCSRAGFVGSGASDAAVLSQPTEDEQPASGKERRYTWLDADGQLVSRKLTEYECQLEDDVQMLQDALFSISSHYAKVQFRLRQIASASGQERLCLLQELERVTCQGLDHSDMNSEVPNLLRDSQNLGNVRVRQQKIIAQLRSRLSDLADATDVCLCGDPECGHHLAAAETDQSSLSVDDSHDKFCSCIVCKESGGRCKVPVCEDGYVSEIWPSDEADELGLFDDFADKRSRRKKKKSKPKSKRTPPSSSRRASPSKPGRGANELREATAKRFLHSLQRQGSSWMGNGGLRSKLMPPSQPRPDRRRPSTACQSQMDLRRAGRASSVSLANKKIRSRSATGLGAADPKKKHMPPAGRRARHGPAQATVQGSPRVSRNEQPKRIPARAKQSLPESNSSSSNRSTGAYSRDASKTRPGKSSASSRGSLPGVVLTNGSINSRPEFNSSSASNRSTVSGKKEASKTRPGKSSASSRGSLPGVALTNGSNNSRPEFNSSSSSNRSTGAYSRDASKTRPEKISAPARGSLPAEQASNSGSTNTRPEPSSSSSNRSTKNSGSNNSRPEPSSSSSSRSTKASTREAKPEKISAPDLGLQPAVASTNDTTTNSLERTVRRMSMCEKLRELTGMSRKASPSPKLVQTQPSPGPPPSLPPAEVNWEALEAELRAECPKKGSCKSCLRSKDAHAQCRKTVRYEPLQQYSARQRRGGFEDCVSSSSQLQVSNNSLMGVASICGGFADDRPARPARPAHPDHSDRPAHTAHPAHPAHPARTARPASPARPSRPTHAPDRDNNEAATMPSWTASHRDCQRVSYPVYPSIPCKCNAATKPKFGKHICQLICSRLRRGTDAPGSAKCKEPDPSDDKPAT